MSGLTLSSGTPTAARRVGGGLRSCLVLLLAAATCLPSSVSAARSIKEQEAIGHNLYTSSVTYCAPPTGILVSSFSFDYFQKNESAVFELSAATVSDNLNPEATISLHIYGREPSNWTIDVCSYLDGLLCPLPQINFTGGSPLPVPASIIKDIPGIAYTVPNLDAYVTVIFNDVVSGDQIACLQASLSNGWSTRQPGVLWGSSMFALLAVAVAWLHTAWNYSRLDPLTLTRGDEADIAPTEAELVAGGLVTGNSSPAQWRVVDIVYLFQTMASCGLLSIDYPSVFSAFVLNFRWSLGMFRTPAVQSAINSARAKTGGKMPNTAYPEIAFINKKTAYHSPVGGSASSSSSPLFSAAVQPTFNKLSDFLTSTLPASAGDALAKRASVDGSTSMEGAENIGYGIPVYVESLGIPTANAWMTVFFTWLMIVAVFLAFHAVGYVALWATDALRTRRYARIMYGSDKAASQTWWLGRLRRNYKLVMLSNALRVALMMFFPICIFTLYQFTLDDAWLPIFLAALVLFITVAGLLLAEGSLLLAARRSHAGVDVSPKAPPLSTADSSSTSSPDSVERDNSLVDLTNAGGRASGAVGVPAVPRSMWSPFPNLRPLCSALYQQYRRPMHSFWLLPLLFAAFAKACFIAFAKNHGLVQLIALIVIEGLTFITLVVFRPHTNKKGDGLSAGLAAFRLFGTGLMLSFFPRLHASGIAMTVMGLVCVAVWGFAVILLLLGLFFNAFWGIIWKRHTPTSAIDGEANQVIRLAEEPRPVLMEKEGSALLASDAHSPVTSSISRNLGGPISTFGDSAHTDEGMHPRSPVPATDAHAPTDASVTGGLVSLGTHGDDLCRDEERRYGGYGASFASQPVSYAPVTDEPGSVADHGQRPLSGGSFITADSEHDAPAGSWRGDGAPMYTPATAQTAYWDALDETPGTAMPAARLSEN